MQNQTIEIDRKVVGVASKVARESASEIVHSLSSLAREALKASGNDTDVAAEWLSGRLEDPAIRKVVAADIVAMAAGAAIRAVRSSDRALIDDDMRRRQAGEVLARAGAVDRALMDYPLPFGGVLADATRAEISRAVEHYRVSSKTALMRAAWLERVGAKLPDDATPVRAALTEADLAAEWVQP